MLSTKHKEAIPGGGRTLAVKKGTDCGWTAVEWWLSRRERVEEGCPLIILYDRGAVRVFASNVVRSNNNCMHSKLLLKPG